jgi:NitT/TauT family transport system substrate-binding protein
VDLKGKTIGVAKGTSGEFFLGRFLTFNDISLKEITIVDLKPFDLAGALREGRVDAVLGWEPLTYDIVKQAGDSVIEWPAQEGQDFYWLLVTREDVIKSQQEKLEKLLRALSQAAEFVQEHPEAAREIIAQGTKVPLTDLQAGKYPKRYKLFLDQGLLLAMEDQARWMIRNNLSGQHARVPNYLGFMEVEALSRANPAALNLVVPRDQK